MVRTKEQTGGSEKLKADGIMINTFLQQVARSIVDKLQWEQLSRTTLVLPSHRAGLVLKDELLRLQQERHAQALWAPEVLTLPQLQDQLSRLYAEDELFTIIRLYKLYRQSSIVNLPSSTNDIMSLDLFYGWGRQMIADFTNIDASMPAEQVPNFFANTIAAHELSQLQLDPEVEQRLHALIKPTAGAQQAAGKDSIRAQYELIWQQLYELYKALRSEMEAEQKGYPGMRQRSVIEHWDDEETQSKIAGRTYVFVGFNYLLPVERELMERFRDAGQALFYWDYVPDFKTNEKAFSFARLNHSILGGENRMPEQYGNPTLQQCNIIQCVSREAQAQFVHRWLQDNYSAHGQRVGIVICDETMLEPVIYTLPAVTLPGEDEPASVNITKGFPLSHTQAFANVMAWLNDPQRGAAEDIVTPEIIDLLLKEALSGNPEESSDENLKALSWQELLILESEYQVRKIVNQMRQIITAGIDSVPFTLKLLRLLVRRAMESVTMPFHGEPVTDIQVMGVLETRLLDFDNLLILNVEEGVVPQKQSDSSFIPFYLRKAYHMQTSDERATVYAYNFFRLLNRAQHATLLFSSADSTDGGKGMSRFVMQLLVSPEFNVHKMLLREAGVLSAAEMEIPQEAFVSLQSTGRSSLSPSAINTYITCPHRFYFSYVLDMPSHEKEDALFTPNIIGSFVHYAMEFIYRVYFQCDSSKPVRIDPDQLEQIRNDENVLQTALQAAYEAMNKEWEEKHEGESNHYIAQNHPDNVYIIAYIKNILDRDIRDAREGLQIWLLEKKRYFFVDIDEIGAIRIGGAIDRLDIQGKAGQERVRVVDYKSSNYSEKTPEEKMASSWEELLQDDKKGYVLQTLLYSTAVSQSEKPEQPVEPNLYFCKRNLSEIQTNIVIEGKVVQDIKAIEEPFLEVLKPKIKEIFTTTYFPKCEEGKCPSYCGFFDLCGRKPKKID